MDQPDVNDSETDASPSLSAIASPLTGEDPELSDLPNPPRRQRTVAVVLMSIAAIVSILMCWALFGEAAYATLDSTPSSIDDLSNTDTLTTSNRYVTVSGTLSPDRPITFSRPFDDDSFQLFRIEGPDSAWVELRVPSDIDREHYVAPTRFSGRLVRLSHAGIRHIGVAGAIEDNTKKVSDNTWLLVDGATPKASRWALALFIVFGLFALWNTTNVARVLRPVR